MKPTLIVIIFVLIATASIYGQSTQRAASRTGETTHTDMMRELDTYLSTLATEDKFSGTVLVAKDGVPIFKKAYGLANKSRNAPNDTETKFNIGSMNKMFTAVAVAQLAERGKLSFDDPISKHLPHYPNKSVADKVTIHQLLTHTSGLGNYQNEKFFAQLNRVKALADLLPFFANEPLAFEPGTKWEYSNAGYVVLGLIIEKASGQSYFDYVRDNIFKPAGMSNTDSYEKGANVSNLAIGYTRMGPSGQADPTAPRRENTQMRPQKGSSAGGGYSTLGDLLRFVIALQSYKLLSKKYTEIVTTGKIEVGGMVGKYAYGFGDKIFNGRHIIGHNGGSAGVAANLDIFPELGYTSIILSNYDPPAMMPVIMKIRELIPAGSSHVSPQPQKSQEE
jgi:CubicO group peptidase (beta-lactamase class C family)